MARLPSNSSLRFDVHIDLRGLESDATDSTSREAFLCSPVNFCDYHARVLRGKWEHSGGILFTLIEAQRTVPWSLFYQRGA